MHTGIPDAIPMIRVTKTQDQQSGTIITIDGQLSGESIALVEGCCSEADEKREPVHLFLRDVTAVDQDGKALLLRLARKGIHLHASGVYTSYLVQSLCQ